MAWPQGYIIGQSRCLGPIEEALKTHSLNRGNIFTIFSQSQDRSREHNEIQGYQYRKVFFADDSEVFNSKGTYDRLQYVRMTVVIAKQDEAYSEPIIYVEQRVYEAGEEKIAVHELNFGGKIQADVEYVFPACGDEDFNLGKRDLKVNVKSLDQENFDYFLRRGTNHYGYDRQDTILVDEYKLRNGLTNWQYRGQNGEAAGGITFNKGDLQDLLLVKRQRQLLTGEVACTENVELLKLTLQGLGEKTEDGGPSGDLHLRIVYTPE